MVTASRSLTMIAISLLAPIIRVGWWLGLEDTDFGEYARTRGRWGAAIAVARRLRDSLTGDGVAQEGDTSRDLQTRPAWNPPLKHC